MDKRGKLRSLVRDLSKKYAQDDDCKKLLCAIYHNNRWPSKNISQRTPLRSVRTLESSITEMEKHYDGLNVAFAQCDASEPTMEFPNSIIYLQASIVMFRFDDLTGQTYIGPNIQPLNP